MKKIILGLAWLLAADMAHGQAANVTQFRLLACTVSIESAQEVIFRDSQNVVIPEVAFNYAEVMQTFWQTLKFAYIDKRDGKLREVSVTPAMNRLGANEGLSYLSFTIVAPSTGEMEFARHVLRGTKTKIGSWSVNKLNGDDINVGCTLTSDIRR